VTRRCSQVTRKFLYARILHDGSSIELLLFHLFILFEKINSYNLQKKNFTAKLLEVKVPPKPS
jgi:hypothetical protein